jgi:hypothetical protein
VPIPLNSLRQWIIGLPGDATDYSLDDRYRLRELNFGGGIGLAFVVDQLHAARLGGQRQLGATQRVS